MSEFVVAFGVFRDVMCERFPGRRVELDTYLAIIADLSLSYGGTMFYEYHKGFSAKAALYVQRFNLRLDWSVLDLELVGRTFTGLHPLSCVVCGSFSHLTGLCPLTVPSKAGEPSRDVKPGSSGMERRSFKRQVANAGSAPPVCMYFNEGVCTYPNCRFLHVCSQCSDAHPRSACPRWFRPAGKGMK